MADDISAGGISVELKAQFDNLATGILQAQQQMAVFSKNVKQAAADVNQAGKDMADGLEIGSLGSLRAQERFVRMGAQMIALQVGLTSLASHTKAAFGEMNLSAGIGAVAFERFITVFGSFPTKASAVLGIVIGIAEAFAMASKVISEIEKKMDDLNKRIERSRQKAIESGAKEDTKVEQLPGVQGEIQQRIDAQVKGLEKLNLLQREYDDAQAQEAAFRDVIIGKIKAEQERIQALLDAQASAKEKGFTFDENMITGAYKHLDDLNKQLGTLVGKTIDSGNALHNSGMSVQEYTDKIRDLRMALDFSKTLDSLAKTGEALATMGEISKVELGVGLVTPLQATDEVLRAMRRDVDETVKAIVDLKAAANLAGNDEELRTILMARATELESYLPGKVATLKSQEQLSESQKQAGVYAQGLSRSIGDAISQGILNGEKAMQVLADVGKNLFSNMLTQSVDQFEKSMVKAFQSIAGTGGEVLGAALTGVLGVVGGILSRGKSGTTSYNSVQSQIQSTEAVRGIVAGPTNVAIEAVGSDIMRANAPVVAKLQEILEAIINQGRSGAGGGGGLGLAGFTPTP